MSTEAPPSPPHGAAVVLPGDWTAWAACRAEDPELFFPIGTTGPALHEAEEAKAVCAHCPVRNECLDWALRVGEAHGVWGGTTPEERRWLRRSRPSRRPSSAPPVSQAG